jgi:hypothetical protein
MKMMNSSIREFDLLRVVVWSLIIGYGVFIALWTSVKILRLIF